MPTENKLTPSLPEVKRWQLKGFIPGVEGESKAVFRPVVVLADDFDRVTAERDALQLRLNAADQRIDELSEAYVIAGEREHTLRAQLAERPAVNAQTLRTVLQALCGPTHHIRELQAIRGIPGGSPIDELQHQFNEWVRALPAVAEPAESR